MKVVNAFRKVYKFFMCFGLLKMLQDDYEDLHGVGEECLMDFFDELFSGEMSKDVLRLVLSIVIPHVGRC